MRATRCLVLAVAVALLCRPAASWYRQAAAPLSYPVGRASGLLSGLHRLPYSRRSDSKVAAQRRPAALHIGLAAPLRAMVSTRMLWSWNVLGLGLPTCGAPWAAPLQRSHPGTWVSVMLSLQVPCVTDVNPKLRSCRLLPGVPGALQCRAAVTVSLVSTECAGA
ncbi:neuropeptide B [Lagopus leucura]|uniref:neuropeptide B n=1 Tax=Lagopus leucura TaxID=30410 RepID=UPI001C672E45|nr:neuropeptide B [Lagopus leucura]